MLTFGGPWRRQPELRAESPGPGGGYENDRTGGDAQAKMPDARTRPLRLLFFAIVCRIVTAAEISVWTVDINSVSVAP